MGLRFRSDVVDSFCFFSGIRKVGLLSKYEKSGRNYGEWESSLIRIMVGLSDTTKGPAEVDVC